MSAFADAIRDCTDVGVTERPPVHGVHYVGFCVHPKEPGPLTLAIGHRAGGKTVIDLVRGNLTVAQAAALVSAYGIVRLEGADDEGDASDSRVHATAGVVWLLQRRLS